MQLVYQTIDWSKQPRALPHFTNGHFSAYFSLPLFLRKISHSFSSTMFVTFSATSLEKGDLQVEKIEAFVPFYAVLKYWLEKPLLTRGRANSKQNKDWKKLPHPPRCD